MAWKTYTYGDLPPKRVFMSAYRRILGDEDANYAIWAGASGALEDWAGDYDAEELWDAIKAAVADPDAWDRLGDSDGPLAVVSSILQTLEIEWI